MLSHLHALVVTVAWSAPPSLEVSNRVLEYATDFRWHPIVPLMVGTTCMDLS